MTKNYRLPPVLEERKNPVRSALDVLWRSLERYGELALIARGFPPVNYL